MDLTSSDLAALKAEAHDLPAVLQVGKAGLTEAVVAEIEARLKRDRLLKIRLLRSATESGDRKEIGKELAERAHAVLVEVRGNTVVLYRPRRGTRRAGSGPAAP